MLGSRALGVLKNFSRLSINKTLSNKSQVRFGSHEAHGDPHGGWRYRVPCKPEKWASRMAVGSAAFCYWWIYWNLYHGYPHLIGLYGPNEEFLPDPRGYTDEELGIPPDEAGL